MLPGTVAMVLAAAVAHAVWNLASMYKRGDALLFVCAYTYASVRARQHGPKLRSRSESRSDWLANAPD